MSMYYILCVNWAWLERCRCDQRETLSVSGDVELSFGHAMVSDHIFVKDKRVKSDPLFIIV